MNGATQIGALVRFTSDAQHVAASAAKDDVGVIQGAALDATRRVPILTVLFSGPNYSGLVSAPETMFQPADPPPSP